MAKRNNLLFITTDQQRFDSLPCYGADFVAAPNLEALAAESTVFDSCYVASPVCVPCRSTLMTGLFPSTLGTMNNDTWIKVPAERWTEAADRAGYRTAAIGKMHFAPWDAMEGFSERIICEDKRHSYLPDDHMRFLAAKGIRRPHPASVPGYFESHGAPDYPFPAECHPDAFVADQAERWLRKVPDGNFALWVSFVGPHDPYDPPGEYSRIYDGAAIPRPIPRPADPASAPSYAEQMNEKTGISNSMFRLDYTKASEEQMMGWRRHYYGNITLIDEGIGKILRALDDAGLRDSTTVVFTSDHGDALGDHGMVFKGYFYESMVRVPLIVREPGPGKAKRARALVGTTDIVAYFYDVLGISPRDGIHGISLASVLGSGDGILNEVVFSEMPSRRMVFDGRYKLIVQEKGAGEFFDLIDDPLELVNRRGDPSLAEVAAALTDALCRHTIRCDRHRIDFSRMEAYPPRRKMEEEYQRSMEGLPST